jgi:hypothetical protein
MVKRFLVILFTISALITNAQIVTSKIPFKNTLLFSDYSNQSLELLTDEGYFRYDFKKGVFNSKPLYGFKHINNHTLTNETFLITKALGKTYFLLNGGGELYSIFNDTIKREDYSFAHKNQFNGQFFNIKNLIYYYGGYGYYRSKDFFIYFNEPTSDWQILIHDNKKIPRGRTNALFQTFEDKIYIAGGKHASGKNNNTELNDVFSFDFKDKTFNVLGNLNSKIQKTDFKWFTPSHLNFSLFINNKNELVSVEIRNNKYEIYDGLDYSLKNNKSPLTILGDSLYYITKFENSKYLNRIALKKLVNYKKEQGFLFEKTGTNNYLNFIFLTIGVFVLWVFFKIFKYVDNKKENTFFRE